MNERRHDRHVRHEASSINVNNLADPDVAVIIVMDSTVGEGQLRLTGFDDEETNYTLPVVGVIDKDGDSYALVFMPDEFVDFANGVMTAMEHRDEWGEIPP